MMTPEQIRARCEQWTDAQRADWSGVMKNVESLYREAIAAGLEMAADKSDRYPCNPEARRGMASLSDWCREQANKLEGEKIEGGAMKHLLSGVMGAMMMFLAMWFTMGEQSDCRSIQASYEQQLQEAHWQAKLSKHRLSKTQRELGAQLAQKVDKIDDVMPIKVQAMSKVDAEVASITALAKSLTLMEAEARKGTELIDPNPAPRSWWHWVWPTMSRLAAGRW